MTTDQPQYQSPPQQSIGLELRRFHHRLKLWQRWWLRPHRPYMPLFVLATYRSGSNLLLDYLNGFPDVQCYAEVLNHRLPIGLARADLCGQRALRHLRYSLQSLRTPIRGCKLMLDQLSMRRLTAADLRQAFPGAKFIILYRESLAEQLLSVRAARATQQWIVHQGSAPRQSRLTLDPRELQEHCKSVRYLYRDLLTHEWLQGCSVLLSYEELVADPAWIFAQRICPLLDVPSRDVQTTLEKQNRLPLAERVANYNQVAALLTGPQCRQKYQWSVPSDCKRAA